MATIRMVANSGNLIRVHIRREKLSSAAFELLLSVREGLFRLDNLKYGYYLSRDCK